MSHATGEAETPRGKYLFILSLTAMGVVYGDIGTSPLYAIRECFYGEHGVPVTPANVMGVLSLILWSLLIVISVKYLGFILRADNQGEGGILALMSLVHPEHTPVKEEEGSEEDMGTGRFVLIALGIFGAALLYGDGMITPAISVLSAVEGLEVATPVFEPYVIPITIVILVALFMLQRRGTAKVGMIFGPVTVVWFVILALLGVGQIIHAPAVLAAVSPSYAVAFFLHNGWEGFLVLGAVFLVVTGGEALYADMGHFGRRPIRLTWFGVVLPALVINYFGQGALLLRNAAAAHNPFYRMGPDWAIYPLVLMATFATIIASQAVISGAFSLTMQAIQLGYSPRIQVQHTSAEERGQIYIPLVNWILMIATILLVLGFKRSTNLAAAYGVAVTTTMVITTLIFYVVALEIWKWPRWKIGLLASGFLCFDLAFFGANALKFVDGGWFPVAVAVAVFTIFMTWRRGRKILAERLRIGEGLSPEEFLESLRLNPPVRVPGTGIFMTGDPYAVPHPLLHNLKHNKVLHERVGLLNIRTADVPYVPRKDRVRVRELGDGFYRIVARYGFMQNPRVPQVLDLAREQGFETKMMETTFFLGRERIIATERPGMAIWRERLFAFLSRNAQGATDFFDIPRNRVIEIGAQVEI